MDWTRRTTQPTAALQPQCNSEPNLLPSGSQDLDVAAVPLDAAQEKKHPVPNKDSNLPKEDTVSRQWPLNVGWVI